MTFRMMRAAVTVAVTGLVGCSSPELPGTGEPLDPSPFIAAAAAATEMTYFSLPHGSIPTGAAAAIRVVRTGNSASVPMIDGGFDPVSLNAVPGDTISVTVVQNTGTAPLLSYRFIVPSQSPPPVVIRTDPAADQRNVPVTAQVKIVFSEPVDPNTLTSGAISLRSGTIPVPGSVDFADGSHTAILLTPVAVLSNSSDYEVVVGSGIRDVGGAPLAAPVTVAFSTVPPTTPPPPPAAPTVTISPSAATIVQGRSTPLSVALKNAAGQVQPGKVFTWRSTSPSVATVVDGVVTAVAPGVATIEATSDGVTGVATITVVQFAVASVAVSPRTATVEAGVPLALSATLTDVSGNVLTGRPVTWQSSSSSIATVSPTGSVTGVSQGVAVITAQSEGISGTAIISVNAPAATGTLSEISFYPTSQILFATRTAYIGYFMRDEFGRTIPPRPVTITSSNPAVLVINSEGTMTGVSAGEASVSVTAEGKTGVLHVTVLSADLPAALAAGNDFTCSLSYAGSISCWGNNSSGQLGNGTTASSSVPVRVAAGAGIRFASLTAGRSHACAVTTTGTGYCWGDNTTGQLGNGSLGNSTTPTEIQPTRTFSRLSAGGGHTCGIATNHLMYCWGDNSSGQLGDGSTVNSTTPSIVALGFLSFDAVATGDNHTCGVSFAWSSSTYCWGLNSSGQLGNGTQLNSSIPVLVAGYNQSYTITAGANHTCTEYSCWGANTFGQLGQGSTLNSLVPVSHNLPSYYDDYISVVAGGNHSCGYFSGSQLYCWGNNTSGQIGNASTSSSSVPVPLAGVASLLRFDVIAAGGQHSCGVAQLGALYCWGANSSGQLGNGSTANSTTPVKVLGQP